MVHVEVAPGVVTVIAAWMLDAAACACMEIGPARVAAPALADLHRLLTTLGFRTDFSSDSNVAQGNDDCESAVGFGADQRDKMLTSPVTHGSRACADSQAGFTRHLDSLRCLRKNSQ